MLRGTMMMGLCAIAMLSTPMALAQSCAVENETPAPKRFSEADEALHLDRFAALMESFRTQAGLASYDSLVAVPGAPDGGLPAATSAAGTIAPEAIAQAEAYAASTNSSALIIWHNGKMVTERYFGSTKADEPLNARSFAKPLTAIAIGRAMQLGMIKSLDQPVADFIPAWRNDPCKGKILIRHLLDMRTGFLPQAAAGDPQHILNRAYLHPRHDEIIIHDYPVVSDPGTRYDYSNATSELVAPVIEAASGMEYEDFISRQVIQKIGGMGGSLWVNRAAGMAHSGCCILLPATDWLRLSLLLLNEGKWSKRTLLPAGYVDQMRTATAQNSHYGLGVWVAGGYIAERGIANPDQREYTTLHSQPYAAGDLFLFDGNGNQVSYIVPSENLVILRMGGTPPKTIRWDNSKLPNLILNGIIKPNPKRVAQDIQR